MHKDQAGTLVSGHAGKVLEERVRSQCAFPNLLQGPDNPGLRPPFSKLSLARQPNSGEQRPCRTLYRFTFEGTLAFGAEDQNMNV